jgi:hypothetical protein
MEASSLERRRSKALSPEEPHPMGPPVSDLEQDHSHRGVQRAVSSLPLSPLTSPIQRLKTVFGSGLKPYGFEGSSLPGSQVLELRSWMETNSTHLWGSLRRLKWQTIYKATAGWREFNGIESPTD